MTGVSAPALGATVAVATALVVALAGCGTHGRTPPLLVDGTRGGRLPDALRRFAGRAVVARVRVRTASGLDVAATRCVRSFHTEFDVPAATTVVERVGVLGTTLTFADRERRSVLGCDRASAGSGRWCARSVGELRPGRLRDPRVDILCRAADGRAVAFAWIDPGPATRWIAVDSGSTTEIAPVAGSLPVRIAGLDVDEETSSASFSIAELGAAGKEVRRYRVRATVAG